MLLMPELFTKFASQYQIYTQVPFFCCWRLLGCIIFANFAIRYQISSSITARCPCEMIDPLRWVPGRAEPRERASAANMQQHNREMLLSRVGISRARDLR